MINFWRGCYSVSLNFKKVVNNFLLKFWTPTCCWLVFFKSFSKWVVDFWWNWLNVWHLLRTFFSHEGRFLFLIRVESLIFGVIWSFLLFEDFSFRFVQVNHWRLFHLFRFLLDNFSKFWRFIKFLIFLLILIRSWWIVMVSLWRRCLCF